MHFRFACPSWPTHWGAALLCGVQQNGEAHTVHRDIVANGKGSVRCSSGEESGLLNPALLGLFATSTSPGFTGSRGRPPAVNRVTPPEPAVSTLDLAFEFLVG